MLHLSEPTIARLLWCVRDLQAIAGKDALRRGLASLSGAVSCESVLVHVVRDHGTSREMTVHPFDWLSASDQAAIDLRIHQHPFFAHPLFVQRFVPGEALREHPAPRLHDDFVRRLVGGEIVTASLPASPGRRRDGTPESERIHRIFEGESIGMLVRNTPDDHVAFVLSRRGPRFTEEESRILRLLQPFIVETLAPSGAPRAAALSPSNDPVRPRGAEDPRARIARLSPRERKVAQLLAGGLQTKEIASRLGTSPTTVHKQTMAVYAKLNVSGRTEAAVLMARFADPSPLAP